MFLHVFCLGFIFSVVDSQVGEASKCADLNDAACAAKTALIQDAVPADSVAVELLQRTGKKLMGEADVKDHTRHKGSGHTEGKVQLEHGIAKGSGDVAEFKSRKASNSPASSGISRSATNVVKALQGDDSTQNTFYNWVLFQFMSLWVGMSTELHRFILIMMNHINSYVMIATISICIIFRFNLQYVPVWIYEALTMKKTASTNSGTLKMPFSYYIGRALHFTTPASNPTWIYTTSRNFGQSTVLRASLWFAFLVPFILFVWVCATSPSVRHFMNLGLANIGIYQIGITALYNILAPWPEKDEKHVNNPEYLKKIGCIVPCHQSADEIATTVKSLLKFLEPEHIVIVDNGNSVKPLDDTSRRIQELEPRVKYMWVPVGHKTNALWMGLNNLPSSVEYVMHIDDDTELPDDMVFDEQHWENEQTDAVSYGITMYQTGWVEKFVDFEFKQISQLRLFQSNFASVWFQHGIIGIWRRQAFTEILKEHPFLPFGEDNWNGTINLLKNRQMRQELRSCVVTYAPATLLPVTGNRQQGYGAANIWKQRADRWCVNAPRRFWIRLYLFLFYRMDTWRGAVVFRLISLEHLLGIIAHLCIPMVLIKMVVDDATGHGQAGHALNHRGTVWALIHMARSVLPLGPLLVYTLLDSCFQNYVCWRHRPDIQVSLKTVLLYPFYQSFLMVCCWYGHWRCLFWYIPFVPMRHGLYTEGAMNAEMLKQIHKIGTVPEGTKVQGIIDECVSKEFIKTVEPVPASVKLFANSKGKAAKQDDGEAAARSGCR